MSDTQRTPVSLATAFGRTLLLGCLAMASGAGLAQALNDVPMAVKNNVPPNFMFMLDNSGSMNNIVPTSPYASGTDYTPGADCASANVIASNATTTDQNRWVDLRVTGGVPFIRYNGTSYRHSTAATGTMRCFDRTSLYLARLLADSGGAPSGYLPALYDGNYLNWYFGTAGNATTYPQSSWTNRKRITAPVGAVVETRLEITKASATTVISNLVANNTAPTIRTGLSTYYNSNDGGALRVAIGNFDTTKKTDMLAAVAALTTDGQTPLAETLADIGRYMATGFSGDITYGSPAVSVPIGTFLAQDGRASCLRNQTGMGGTSNFCAPTTTDNIPSSPSIGTSSRPIQLWCQRSYAFMMTDGRPQGDQAFQQNNHLKDYDGDCVGTTCSGGFDRKTTRQYESAGSDYLDDVAKALFDIDLRPNLPGPTYVVNGETLNRKTKNNLITYTIGFADRQVKNDPLLISAATQGGGKALFPENGSELISAFNSVITDAFSKDAAAAAVAVANAQITAGSVGYASSYKSGAWYGDLVAYSLDPTTALQTGTDLWSLQTTLAAQTPASRKIATYNGSTGVAFAAGLTYSGKPSTLDDEVINYVRGDRTGEGSSKRARQHVLGDIINAEPVVVNYDGTPIIFQGANDGMLHVVDGRTSDTVATRGQELWAYVPRLVHANLSQLTSTSYQHNYFIDGTPAVADVTGVGSVTKLLVGGLGKGGKGYYALNISTYTAATQADAAAKVMWEFTPTGIGYSFGAPLIVKVGSSWRVVVASGYDATVHGIWVIDPSTGSGPFIAATSASGLAHLGRLANTAADADTRFVWGGDNAGNVYRFDLVSLSSVRIAALTDSSGAAQPVTSAPEVGLVPGSSTKFLVHIGTGRYLADSDVPGPGQNAQAVQRQSIYGLVDDTTVAAPPTLTNMRGSNGSTCSTSGTTAGGDGTLVCQVLTYVSASNRYQASTNAVDYTARRGWYLDLPTDTTPADINMINGRVINKPALTNTGVLTLTVNIPTNVQCDPGGRSWFVALNSATGGAVPRNVGGNTYFESGFFLGTALASRPVLVITGNEKRALIRMSDKRVEAVVVPEPASTAAQWRRIYSRPVK
jgi:type IV pilus assembly protein PilY1